MTLSTRMTNPYDMRDLTPPPLDTIDDFVRVVTGGGDRRVMNYALWEARQDCSKWLALFLALANVPRPSVDCRRAFFEVLTGDHGLRIRDHFSVDPLVPADRPKNDLRSEEHTSELQSR